MTDPDTRLGHWPLTIEIPVAWGEMDAFRHVNNVAYLRYIESARIAYFDATQMSLEALGAGPILASQTIHYKRPLTYPDRVRVSVTTTKIGNTSFVMAYRIVSDKHGLAAEAETVCVWFDYKSGGKIPVDARLRDAIYALEARA
jgi:acyl-CoA thioester hydrolase